MTRIHDGSPPPLLQPETSEEPAVRDVLVSYDEFKQRRQLRRRVMAALEKLQPEPSLDAEFRAVTHVQAPATGDETP